MLQDGLGRTEDACAESKALDGYGTRQGDAAELQAAQSRLGDSEKRVAEERQRIAELRAEAEAARSKCAELRGARDKATDERKATPRHRRPSARSAGARPRAPRCS